MAILKLTADAIKALPPATDEEVQAYYWDIETKGFGVVVGALNVRGQYVKTFVAQGYIAGTGKRCKTKIGIVGAPSDGGHVWTVLLAKRKAIELLGEMARGVNPNDAKRPDARPAGPTLRDALAAHVERQKKRNRAERTIETLTNEIEKYLAAWLDRPIAELTGAVLIETHERIKRKAKARANSNPNNAKGAALANRVIANVSACWNSLNRKLEGALGNWNPSKSVDRDTLAPKRQRIDDAALPGWLARVETLDPIRRDGLVLALYTGLRSEDVRTIRHEHVDLKARTLRLPDPKGGEAKAFTIPLSSTCVQILKRRLQDNANPKIVALIADRGGDGGYAFPAPDNDGGVGPISDLRKQLHNGEHSRFPVEDVHTLRRTWESIAHETGVGDLDLHVLSNHAFSNRNVHESYIAQSMPHLHACAEKIDRAMTDRLSGQSARATSRRPKRTARVLPVAGSVA